MNPAKKIEGWNYSVFTDKKTEYSEKVRRNNERTALMMMQKALNLPTEFHGKFTEMINMLEIIQNSLNQHQEVMNQLSSGGNNSGGGGGMDNEIEKIKEKISAMSEKVSVTESEVKNIGETLKRYEASFGRIDRKLEELPTKSDMAVIVQDILHKLDLPSKEYVNSEIGKTEISLHKWIVSTGIAVIVLVSGIVFGIIKTLHS